MKNDYKVLIASIIFTFMFIACSGGLVVNDDLGSDSPFAYDLILVVLTYEATFAAFRANKMYAPADFPEFNFSRVENFFTMRPTGPYFRRLLFLHLAEPSKENVLLAIRLVEQRADVESANPNYYRFPGNI